MRECACVVTTARAHKQRGRGGRGQSAWPAMSVSTKVRAVYDALEMRKNKQALKLLAPLLDKKPTNAQLRILKALALVRSGRKEEALALSRELKGEKEVQRDETLLNNLAIVFREGGSAAEATACFEAALANDPGNEELALCLFGAYVRERNFLKLQQQAQKMAKQFGRDAYAVWAIVATSLQVSARAHMHLMPVTAHGYLHMSGHMGM